MTKQDQWLLARGERDGFPMIVRMAADYRGMGALPGYDHHIIIGAKLRAPTSTGFPSKEEGEDLQSFEETLCAAIEVDHESLCVLVITNKGIRVFIFYTRNPKGAKEKLDATLVALTGFEFSIAIEPDTGWEIYQAFNAILSPPSEQN